MVHEKYEAKDTVNYESRLGFVDIQNLRDSENYNFILHSFFLLSTKIIIFHISVCH